MSMQAGLDEIIAIVVNAHPNVEGEQDRIRTALSVPPNKLTKFPAAVTFVRRGEFDHRPTGVARGDHVYVLQIHVAMKGALGKEVPRLMLYSETIPLAIYGSTDLHGAVTTIKGISFTFGPLDWGTDTKTLGWEYEIQVKLKSNLTLTTTPLRS